MTGHRPNALRTGLLLATVACLAAGCLPTRRVGHFGDNAFYHARDHYRVRYMDGAEGLLPDRWVLENFELREDGTPDAARVEPDDAFLDHYALSQFAPVRRETAFSGERVDLRYVLDDGVGEIYARTLPVPPAWDRAPLSAMMRRAVVSMTAPLAQAPNLLGHRIPPGTSVHLRGEGTAMVDGVRAHFVTFDLIQTNPGGAERVRRVSVVGVRPDNFRYRVHRWALPMMVVFGHISAPDEHDAQRSDFESFVSRVDFAEPPG